MQKDVCVNYVSLQSINCDLVSKSKFVLKCYLIVKLGCQHFVDKDMCFFMIYTRPNFLFCLSNTKLIYFSYKAARNCCVIILIIDIYSKFNFSNKDFLHRVHAKIQRIAQKKNDIHNRFY